MLSEYEFDYSLAQPNRFATQTTVAVALQEDVLSYLEALALIKGLPLGTIVNDLLKKDIELIKAVTV
ncbi:hypothetical protein CKO12_00900 [Chromatium okenii]|nr:hypothetical protein [Chromatium okenii]